MGEALIARGIEFSAFTGLGPVCELSVADVTFTAAVLPAARPMLPGEDLGKEIAHPIRKHTQYGLLPLGRWH